LNITRAPSMIRARVRALCSAVYGMRKPPKPS
jgi:hypothetical protein